MLVVEIILRTGSGVGSDFRLDSFHDGRDGSNVRLELPRDPHELLQVGAKTGQLGQLKERNCCWQNCGTVGRKVASKTRGPRFASSHQKLKYIEYLFTVILLQSRRLRKGGYKWPL